MVYIIRQTLDEKRSGHPLIRDPYLYWVICCMQIKSFYYISKRETVVILPGAQSLSPCRLPHAETSPNSAASGSDTHFPRCPYICLSRLVLKPSIVHPIYQLTLHLHSLSSATFDILKFDIFDCCVVFCGAISHHTSQRFTHIASHSVLHIRSILTVTENSTLSLCLESDSAKLSQREMQEPVISK